MNKNELEAIFRKGFDIMRDNSGNPISGLKQLDIVAQNTLENAFV